MADKHVIVPAIQAEINFLGYDTPNIPIPSESTKIKVGDIHPTKTLIVHVDGDGRVIVWDFNLKIELLNVHTQDIFNVNAPVAHQPVRSNKSFIDQRLSQRSQMTSLCKVDHILKKDYCKPITFHNDSVSQRKTNAAHTIRSINFCDSDAIYTNTYSTGKHSLHQSSAYSNNSLLVVSDTAVVVYDFVARCGIVLGESELGKAPSGAELIYHNCCAIACVDGSIRLWDLKTNEVCKVLSGHARSAVIVKALPIKSEQGISTPDSSDKVRLLSIGADGAAFVWDVNMSVGLNGVLADTEVAHPIARLKDFPANIGVLKSNIHFDCESNVLSIGMGESKIKQWDMADINNVTRNSLRSQGSSGSLRNKRMSLMNVVGGVSGGARDQYDHIYGISCMGAMKPGEKKEKKVDVSAFCPLAIVPFTVDSFVIASKTNVIGIYKSREGGIGDDKSEKSSVMGGTSEKSQRLQLLHEINVTALLLRYLETSFPSVTLSEALKESLRQGTLKVYNIRMQASQPHLFLLTTSLGIMLLTLNISQRGSLCGVHPSWGNVKLIFSGSSVRRVLLDGIIGGNTSTNNLKRVPSGRQSFGTEDGGGGSTSVGGLDFDVAVEVIGELYVGESQSAAAVVQPKRLSFAPSTKKSSGSAADAPSSRPQFSPSPSGLYCAIHWPDTLHYVVVRVDAGVRTRKDLVEVDRGFALEFAWIGTEDHYITKSVSFIATIGAKKRSSIINLLSAAEKEVSRLHSPQLMLYKCDGEAKASRVKFVSDVQQGVSGQGTIAIHLHSGILLAVTTEATHAEVVSIKNPAAAAASAEGGPPMNVGVIVQDVERAERDVKYAATPPKKAMITRFYALTTAAELKRLESLADISHKTGKSNKKSGKGKGGADEGAAVAEEEAVIASTGAEDLNGAYALVQVGPTLKCVDAVRWNYESGLCGVLSEGTLNILKLQLDSQLSNTGSSGLSLSSVTSVSVAPPVSFSQHVADLTWCDSFLYVTSLSRVFVVCCDAIDDPAQTSGGVSGCHVEVLTVDYAAPLLNARSAVVTSLFASSGSIEYSPVTWSQLIAVQHGHLYLAFRDGSVKKLAVSGNSALCVSLLAASLKYAENEDKKNEGLNLLKKLEDVVDDSDKLTVQSMLISRQIELSVAE